MKEDDELHWSVKHKSGALRALTVAGDPGRLPYCRLLGGVNLLKDFGRGGYTLLLGRFLEEWLKKNMQDHNLLVGCSVTVAFGRHGHDRHKFCILGR